MIVVCWLLLVFAVCDWLLFVVVGCNSLFVDCCLLCVGCR